MRNSSTSATAGPAFSRADNQQLRLSRAVIEDAPVDARRRGEIGAGVALSLPVEVFVSVILGRGTYAPHALPGNVARPKEGLVSLTPNAFIPGRSQGMATYGCSAP